MEIKKYVLTHKGEIYDVRKGGVKGNSSLYGGWEEDRGTYVGHTIEVGEDYPIENETIKGFITKTSDNILDLVEVGDLVEEYDNTLIKVKEIIIVNGEIEFTNFDYPIFDYEVNAIYKKQPNGDFKRYERTI